MASLEDVHCVQVAYEYSDQQTLEADRTFGFCLRRFASPRTLFGEGLARSLPSIPQWLFAKGKSSPILLSIGIRRDSADGSRVARPSSNLGAPVQGIGLTRPIPSSLRRVGSA